MYQFEIHQKPVPQKQTILGKNRRCYDPSKLDKITIQWQINPHAPKEPITGPVEVWITFYMPIPKSTSQVKKRLMINNTQRHINRPDIDNLAYIVTNAMKGIVYKDDSQICDLHLSKKYGDDPKTVIKIVEL